MGWFLSSLQKQTISCIFYLHSQNSPTLPVGIFTQQSHGKEFPDLLSSNQYVLHAKNHFVDPLCLKKTRSNGDVLVYNPFTNTFGAFNKDGLPRTMFKPDPAKHGYKNNLEYYYGQ